MSIKTRMLVKALKIYLYLNIAISSPKNSFQHDHSSDDDCLRDHEPEVNLKYFIHKRNNNKYIEDKKKIDSIKNMCGDLCQNIHPVMQQGSKAFRPKTKENVYQLFEPPSKNLRCDLIWSNSLLESHNNICVPHRILPDYLEREFSYNYTIRLDYLYYDDSQLTKNYGHEIQVSKS